MPDEITQIKTSECEDCGDTGWVNGSSMEPSGQARCRTFERKKTSAEFQDGYAARKEGKGGWANPFEDDIRSPDAQRYVGWREGWIAANREMQNDQLQTSRRECFTHHYACDCREEKFARMEVALTS